MAVIVSFDVGIKNLAYCVLRTGHTENRTEILLWNILSLQSLDEVKRPSNEELTLRLYERIDELVENLLVRHQVDHIDYVLIENQPSRLNGCMKTIQMALYNYFMLRRHWEGCVSAVQLVHASVKLHNHGEFADNLRKNSPDYANKYRLNKWLAVHICKHYISHDQYIQEYFEHHKKCDDLADSFLQAIAWCRKHHMPVAPLLLLAPRV